MTDAALFQMALDALERVTNDFESILLSDWAVPSNPRPDLTDPSAIAARAAIAALRERLDAQQAEPVYTSPERVQKSAESEQVAQAEPRPTPTPPQVWKCGNEYLPYHPQASHVPPDYRDGWNACYRAAPQQPLRVLTRKEAVACFEPNGWAHETAAAIQRKFCAVNGLTLGEP